MSRSTDTPSTPNIIFETKSSQIKNVPYFFLMAVCLGVGLYFARDAEVLLHDTLAWLNASYIGQPADRVKFLSMGIVALVLATPGFMFVWRYLDTATRIYQFRSDRLVFHFGILNSNKDNVEYYRVKDFYSNAPFWMRPFGLSHFHLISTDRRSPYLKVPGIKGVDLHEDGIRDAIEKSTESGKGREIDIV